MRVSLSCLSCLPGGWIEEEERRKGVSLSCLSDKTRTPSCPCLVLRGAGLRRRSGGEGEGGAEGGQRGRGEGREGGK